MRTQAAKLTDDFKSAALAGTSSPSGNAACTQRNSGLSKMNYENFIHQKSQIGGNSGFEPVWMPDFLFDFQKSLLEWSVKKGKSAIFADCGLGKTPIQLCFAENVVRKTNKNALIIAPLAVSAQTIREGEKFGIGVKKSRDGKPNGKITVTNYEQLEKFNRHDFECVICDESSAIKNFDGERKAIVTEFLRETPYRLFCTATAAPNDYIELGTSAEALGELGRMDMLNQFFRNDENSNHPIWWGARWQFKAHAEIFFWKWVCSWARAIRKPSDMGFEDGEFKLPPLQEIETIVKNNKAFNGTLFAVQAATLKEQQEERKLTLVERCECAAEKISKHESSLAWCHYNEEGDLLEKIIPDAVQIEGSDSVERKEEVFLAFQDGQIKKLVTKPKCAGWGLNFQSCNHMTFFPSHSFEQYYQGVRRCWRFGQKNPVTVDIITTEGELGVLKNLQRKSLASEKLFEMLVSHMNSAIKSEKKNGSPIKITLPSWIQ